jgi:hypothetical protein
LGYLVGGSRAGAEKVYTVDYTSAWKNVIMEADGASGLTHEQINFIKY